MNKKFAVFVLATLMSASVHLAEAQQAQVRRIGLLTPRSPSDSAPWYQAFRQGLRDLGWVEGKNIRIEYRYAEGRRKRLPQLASDLVRLKVELVVVLAGYTVRAVQRVSKTTPIVMAAVSDPVVGGLVDSLSRPGGNVTGLSEMMVDLAGKRLELLKKIVPKLSRVAVIWNPEAKTSTLSRTKLQLPARGLGIQLHSLEVRNAGDLGKAIEDAATARAGALMIMPSVIRGMSLKRVADLAAKSRLPMIFHVKKFVESCGLVSYAPDRSDMYRRAATFVDKILKGTKPADLPVEQPTKFELVINLKTAKLLGLTIPPEVLYRATKVIK